MEKTRPRKTNAAVKSEKIQKATKLNKLTSSKLTVKPLQISRITDKISSFGKSWKELWAYAGPGITLFNLWFFLVPNIEVTTGTNLDQTQQFQTQFLISNRGSFPVYKVHFACGLMGPNVAIESLSLEAKNLQPISELPAGKIASRGCFSESHIPTSGPLEVSVFYTWPFFGIESVSKTYFTVRKTTSGFAMVPDVSSR